MQVLLGAVNKKNSSHLLAAFGRLRFYPHSFGDRVMDFLMDFLHTPSPSLLLLKRLAGKC